MRRQRVEQLACPGGTRSVLRRLAPACVHIDAELDVAARKGSCVVGNAADLSAEVRYKQVAFIRWEATGCLNDYGNRSITEGYEIVAFPIVSPTGSQ